MSKIAEQILREYQETDIANIETAWESHQNVIYQLPTGGGKSVVAAKIVQDYYKKESILIFAHKRRLLTQLHKRLNDMGIRTGILYAMRAEDLDAKVVVMSIRTAVKGPRLEALLKRKWDRVVIDEARHSRTGSYDTVLQSLMVSNPQIKLLGIDATPYRKDKKRLDEHFQAMVVSCKSTRDLINEGYLCPFRTYASPIDMEALKEQVKEVANDYQSTALSNYMRQPKYLDYIVSQYETYGEGRQAIAFAVDIAHARDLKQRFIDAGITSVAQIDSSLSQEEIDKAFTAYEKKKVQMLINVEMITEGVDLPDTTCIIGARPTKSLTLYLQMVGRGTRVSSDGLDLIILDCCNWTAEFGALDSPKEWSLDPEVDPNNPRSANKVIGKKEDGSYTDDLTDFVGEVIEMTPEEYIEHLAGGILVAEKVNKSIDERIDDLKKEMEKMLNDEMEKCTKSRGVGLYTKTFEDNKSVKIFVTHQEWVPTEAGWEEREYNWQRIASLELWVRPKDEEGEVPLFFTLHSQPDHSRWSSPTVTNVKRYHELTITMGALHTEISKGANLNKKFFSILNVQKKILELQNQKINLSKFKDEANRIKQEEKIKQIEKHLEEKGYYEFNNYERYDSVFPKSGEGWNFYITKMILSKINKHHNTIVFETRKCTVGWVIVNGERKFCLSDDISTYEKKYIKGEKVFEIIEEDLEKDRNWITTQEYGIYKEQLEKNKENA